LIHKNTNRLYLIRNHSDKCKNKYPFNIEIIRFLKLICLILLFPTANWLFLLIIVIICDR